jgi:alginate O-acetyltransferase complex protein AlgI
VRYVDVEKQLQHRTHSMEKFSNGVRLFLFGLCKKVLLANALGSIWDQCKATAGQNTTLTAWIGILAFTFQIFFDFSGYSDMAVGLGKMFGFEFVRNFNYPYTATSITDFWRKWHISLGTWFREYVYIPLGGNKKGLPRQILNLLGVWTLTGIWHSAGWNFLAWGLYFFFLLTLEKLFLLKMLDRLPGAAARALTLFAVLVSWLIFAAPDLTGAGTYLASLFGANGLAGAETLYHLRNGAPFIIAGCFFATGLTRRLWRRGGRRTRIAGGLICAALYVLSLVSVINSAYNPFLYFRF